MPHAVFSDKDIQEYLDGVFTGDVKALLDYLHHTEEGRQRLSFYKLLYNSLQIEPLPELNFSLDDAVIHALDARTAKKAVNRAPLLWIPAGIAAVAIIVYGFAQVSGFAFVASFMANTLFIGLGIIMAVLVVALHGLDWQRQQQRYHEVMGI